MAISMLISLAISFFEIADQSFWIPLTTFCVCLYISTPITALQRTIHRIIGSLYGVILAGGIIIIWPNLYFLLLVLIIFAGLTLWSRAFSALYYLFVTFMTASVIVLLAILMRHTDLTPNYLITERIVFTLIGSIISLVVSAILMPSNEGKDMLKTYRRYLTLFIVDYRKVSDVIDENLIDTNSLNSIYKTTEYYQSKLPIWRYRLFFNVFIYRSLILFLHRIHNMRMLTHILISGLDNLQNLEKNKDKENNVIVTDSSFLALNNYLKQNIKLTIAIIRNLQKLDRDEALELYIQLRQLNDEFNKEIEQLKQHNLKTLVITLREIETEISHLINGPIQHYLVLKHHNLDIG